MVLDAERARFYKSNVPQAPFENSEGELSPASNFPVTAIDEEA